MRCTAGSVFEMQQLQQENHNHNPSSSPSWWRDENFSTIEQQHQHQHQHHQQQQPLGAVVVDSSSNSSRERRQRFLLGFCLASALFGIALDFSGNRRIEHYCLAFIHWVGGHPLAGIFAVIGVYALATILFVPGAILTVGCGFAFREAFEGSTTKGVIFASIAVFIGAFVGSLCSFLLGRYLFRDFVYRLASKYPILIAIDRALERNGFKIMLLLRLSPLIPFNALDYTSGVTSISFLDYALALIGILPGTVMFVIVGATASSLTDATNSPTPQSRVAHQLSLIGGLLFAIIGVAVASYYSKIELDKIIREAESPVSSTAEYMNVGPVEDEIQTGYSDHHNDNNNTRNLV